LNLECVLSTEDIVAPGVNDHKGLIGPLEDRTKVNRLTDGGSRIEAVAHTLKFSDRGSLLIEELDIHFGPNPDFPSVLNVYLKQPPVLLFF
jgi:hypothetical protein